MSNKTTERAAPNRDFVLHPTQLVGPERARHVRDALLDYNKGIIKNNPEGATAKFRKLETSPYTFLRGTADLMYRDFQGTDADMTTVLCAGDVHLENFGVMEAGDGSLIWGLNDFDESTFGPFTWDVKRGATSAIVAGADQGFDEDETEKFARDFAASYLDGIRRSIKDDTDEKARFTRNRGPKLIRKLIKDTEDVKLKKFWKKYVDADKKGLLATEEIEPISERKPDFVEAMKEYVESLAGLCNKAPESIRVLDVAKKTGTGTASVGLWRFYVLIELPTEQDERLILEVKQQRASVMQPYSGEGPLRFDSHGARVAFAEDTQLHDANPYYGFTSLDDKSYLVRKLSPFKERVDLDKLDDRKYFKKYARACGKALASAHARSDRAIPGQETAERRILQSVNRRTFAEDVSHFAKHAAEQVKRDWKSFLKSQEDGEFTFSKD